MIEVVCNDRLGKKVRVKCKYGRDAFCFACIGVFLLLENACSPDDTIGDLKKLIAAQTGTVLCWHNSFT